MTTLAFVGTEVSAVSYAEPARHLLSDDTSSVGA